MGLVAINAMVATRDLSLIHILVTYGRDEKADYRETGYKLLRTHDFLGVAFHVTGKDEMDEMCIRDRN